MCVFLIAGGGRGRNVYKAVGKEMVIILPWPSKYSARVRNEAKKLSK